MGKQPAQDVVWREDAVLELLARERRGVIGLHPVLDGGALVGVPVCREDGVLHQLHCDWARELLGHRLGLLLLLLLLLRLQLLRLELLLLRLELLLLQELGLLLLLLLLRLLLQLLLLELLLLQELRLRLLLLLRLQLHLRLHLRLLLWRLLRLRHQRGRHARTLEVVEVAAQLAPVEAEHDAELAEVVVARGVEVGAADARDGDGVGVLAEVKPAQEGRHVLGRQRVDRPRRRCAELLLLRLRRYW